MGCFFISPRTPTPRDDCNGVVACLGVGGAAATVLLLVSSCCALEGAAGTAALWGLVFGFALNARPLNIGFLVFGGPTEKDGVDS